MPDRIFHAMACGCWHRVRDLPRLMNTAIKLAERHGASVSEILFFRRFGACCLCRR